MVRAKRQRFSAWKDSSGQKHLEVARYVWESWSEKIRDYWRQWCDENNVVLKLSTTKRGKDIDSSDETYKKTNQAIKKNKQDRMMRRMEKQIDFQSKSD